MMLYNVSVLGCLIDYIIGMVDMNEVQERNTLVEEVHPGFLDGW